MDVSSDGQPGALPCAVVLIPRGKDRDFTFSSREGLEQVRRLACFRPRVLCYFRPPLVFAAAFVIVGSFGCSAPRTSHPPLLPWRCSSGPPSAALGVSGCIFHRPGGNALYVPRFRWHATAVDSLTVIRVYGISRPPPRMCVDCCFRTHPRLRLSFGTRSCFGWHNSRALVTACQDNYRTKSEM